MKIYFACSITGGRDDEHIYQEIVGALLEDGHYVPTAHLVQPQVMELEAVVNPGDVFGRDVAWIESCDVLVAEVSTPSHGVGFEIGYALSQAKPVLCCYKEGKRVSKMISGNPHPNLLVCAYRTEAEAVQVVREFVASIPAAD